MGVDAYSVLAYGCGLTEDDVISLRNRIGCNDVYTFLQEFFDAFNKNNNCQLDFTCSDYEYFLYVETPSHTCGGRASSIVSVCSGPTFSMTVADRDLAAIEVLKSELPEASKDWCWKILTYYN